MADFLLARIKPYNPRQGLHIRTYTFKGRRFREEAGWFKVEPELGEQLKDIVADQNDPNSPYVFDVLEEDKAALVEQREQARRERASARSPHATPDLRARDNRRLVAATARARGEPEEGVVTTAALRGGAPNDEVIPNGYPPPRVYPMPGAGSTASQTTVRDSVALEEGADDETLQEAVDAGVDDKTLSVSAANLTRDLNGNAPRLIDGENPDDDFPLEGDTDFGPDNPDPDNPDAPASPPSGRRRRRSGS